MEDVRRATGEEAEERAKHLAWVKSFAPEGSALGLERIEALLSALDLPRDAVPAVHVAGTNGKGSVTRTVAAIFSAAGRRVGIYTSPHLEDYWERVEVDGAPVRTETLAAFRREVEAVLPRLSARGLVPTEFEVMTALAWYAFSREGVDVAAVEVGLGGRLDATNALFPKVAAITTVGYDHVRILGPTLRDIAREKAGILKPGVPVVVGPLPPEAEEVVLAEAEARGAPAFLWGRDYAAEDVVPCGAFPGAVRFTYRGPWSTRPDLVPGLAGAHQAQNAAVAVLAGEILARAAGISLPDEAVRLGLAAVRHKGRLEFFPPDVWLDGAHNPEGARALADALARVVAPGAPGGPRVVFLLAVSADKDVSEILRPLLPLARAAFVTRYTGSRAMSPDVLADHVRMIAPHLDVWITEDPKRAFLEALALARQAGVPLVVCGSLYLVGELRAFVRGVLRAEERAPQTSGMPPGRD
ncbi:bifunctional folylpolyglutamate synthase/dihydrofolate synthase [Brockia lithotrophica]|uniref:tetrahydrofolate synthase n=1 Tax=Brockia lithotrophica TaxID=933949 RepID=A0A660L8B3_9BACL|nr:folylpolyglutamate synthase/dihydrofolate synthase family protein [Brockia lithotrophica]RKQ89109.1 dihydrofolate synthase/folylpolyglutamate synthase [Brockia lithotrophica]